MMSRKTIKGVGVAIGLPTVVYLLFSIFKPNAFWGHGFTTIYNLINQSISTSILAWGMWSEMVLGTLDFSLAAEMIMYEIIAVILYHRYGIIGMLLACTVIPFLFGLIKAAIKDLVNIHSIVVGLGLTYIIGSIGALVSAAAYGTMQIDTNLFASFPYNFIILFVMGGIAWFISSKSTMGAHIAAIGGNPNISKSAGINERKIDFKASVMGSFFAGVAGLVALNRGGGTLSQAGLESLIYIFDAFMCIFVSICLGSILNSVIGVFVGSLTMSILGLGLVSIGLDSELNDTVTSLFLLILIAITTVTSRKAAEKMRREVAKNRLRGAEATPDSI